VVAVTRTGGIAGRRREWRVEPPASDVPHWVALIEDCPWDATPTDPAPGADRFVWRIRARCETPTETVERDAELPEPQVEGPWQTLIDEVRGASGPSTA